MLYFSGDYFAVGGGFFCHGDPGLGGPFLPVRTVMFPPSVCILELPAFARYL